MAELSNSEIEPTLCKMCKLEIRPGAKKCTHCGSHQFFLFNYTLLSVPVLSLLVALSAVLVNGSDNIRMFLFGRSAIIIAGVSNAHSENEVQISFANEGDIAARIENVVCEWVKPTEILIFSIGVELRPETNILVVPGHPVDAKFVVNHRYMRRWTDDNGSEGFGFGDAMLKMSHMIIDTAHACCGETTARCRVNYNDGGSIDKSSNLFWTVKMADWFDGMSTRFDEEFGEEVQEFEKEVMETYSTER